MLINKNTFNLLYMRHNLHEMAANKDDKFCIIFLKFENHRHSSISFVREEQVLVILQTS